MQMNQFQTQLSNSKMSHTQAIINYKVQLLNIKILTRAAIPLPSVLRQWKHGWQILNSFRLMKMQNMLP